MIYDDNENWESMGCTHGCATHSGGRVLIQLSCDVHTGGPLSDEVALDHGWDLMCWLHTEGISPRTMLAAIGELQQGAGAKAVGVTEQLADRVREHLSKA